MQKLIFGSVDIPPSTLTRRQLEDSDVRHDQPTAGTSERDIDEFEIRYEGMSPAITVANDNTDLLAAGAQHTHRHSEASSTRVQLSSVAADSIIILSYPLLSARRWGETRQTRDGRSCILETILLYFSMPLIPLLFGTAFWCRQGCAQPWASSLIEKSRAYRQCYQPCYKLDSRLPLLSY